MAKPLSKVVAGELVSVARLVIAHADIGNIRAEPGREKMLADLRRRAAHALELGQQRREVKR